MGLKIIAEVGSLTRGKVDLAKQCIDAVKEAEADYIKFIFSDAEDLIADKSLQYEGKSLYDTIQSYWMSDSNWEKVIKYCNEVSLPWFASIGTPNYTDKAVRWGSKILKAGAWDVRNFPLFDSFIVTGLPIQIELSCVISGEADNLLEYIYSKDKQAQVSLTYESHGKLNMLTIPYLRQKYKLPIGFSADGRVISPDKLAILYGASSLEKRLKPDDVDGHHTSKALNPKEFKNWVKEVRRWEADKGNIRIEEADKHLLGKEGLYPSKEDVKQKQLWLTSLVYNKDMKAGDTITRACLAARRPGQGLSPYYSYLFEGQKLKKDVKKNSICELVNV